MTDGPPPPLPAGVPPPRPAAPAAPPAPDRDAAVEAQKARSAKTLAGWSIGCTVVLALVCGGGAWFTRMQLVRAVAREERAADVLRAAQQTTQDAGSLLEAIGDRLGADAALGELPVTLPEAPPKDPWGRAIRYARTAPRKAVLTSAGPDGRFGSADDVIRTVDLE